MSNTEQPDDNKVKKVEADVLPPTPERKVKSILQELELLAVQKGNKSTLDTANFTEEQNSTLLEILSKNEDNAFKFHTNRVDAVKEIELAKINSGTINQHTFRIVIIGILIIIPILTILILFYKEIYFIAWLTFLTGLLGGFGLSKIPTAASKESTKNPIIEESKD